jgi:hypothetical protein
MSDALFLPAGVSARLHRLPAGVGHPACWAVLVAAPPVEAVPANLLRPGEAAALLTHDRGVSWPDEAGEFLAAEKLKRGGVAALAFACLADALACRSRIIGGGS